MTDVPAVDSATRHPVLLVDDQHLVRSGFSMILAVEPDIDVVGEAANGQRGGRRGARLRPDVVLMDVQMPVLDGIAATRQIVADDLARSSSSPPSTATTTSSTASGPAPAASCSRTPTPTSSSTRSVRSPTATPCSPPRSPAG